MQTKRNLRLLSVLLTVILCAAIIRTVDCHPMCHDADCLRRLKAQWHISLSRSYFPIVYL